MNGYLLDTNIETAYLKRHPGVRQRIRSAEHAGRPVRLNAVSYYETKRGLLAIGAHKQLAAFERLWRVLGMVMIDHPVLDKAAELSAMLRASGQLIEDADLLIAAIALVHDMTLVTNNTAHFTRIPGLQVEDWLLSCPS
jgi:tRNA(fMet)-specific endonuclease VapC